MENSCVGQNNERNNVETQGSSLRSLMFPTIRRSTEPCKLGGGDNGARLEHSGDPRGCEHPLVAAIHPRKKEQRRQREHHVEQPRRDACPQPALQPRQRLAAQPEPVQRQRDVQGEKGLFPSGIHVSGRAEPRRNHHRVVNQLAYFQRAIYFSSPPPLPFRPERGHSSLEYTSRERERERNLFARFFFFFLLEIRTFFLCPFKWEHEGRALFIEINFTPGVGGKKKRVTLVGF